jgi:SecD/SecF fusion protein
MQNKGAIKIFAILLGLACIFYLSFTYITRGVEADALAYAEGIVTSPKIMAAVKDSAKGDEVKSKTISDAFKERLIDRYLDSVKTQPVYNLGFTSYTYEECKKREINLGLDLRGGMNVTLEVSVIDIVKGLSNYSTDAAFNKALEETQKNLGVKNNDDFVTLFEKTYKQISPGGRLAPLFQTIENKGKIAYNATNEQVITFIRERVEESISNSEKTFRSRIDRFGVAQPNIQKLESSGRILVELPGVKDKDRVRELLQGTANLEFWETYENQEIYQYFDQANNKLSAILYPDFRKAKIDTTKGDSSTVAAPVPVNDITKIGKPDSLNKDSNGMADTMNKAAAKPPVNPNDTMMQNNMKRYPLYSMGAPIKPSVYSDGKQTYFTPGPVVGKAYSKEDTAKANAFLRMDKVKGAFPSKMKFMWSSKPKEEKDQNGSVVGNYFELYAIKVTDRNGKAALYGDIITDARKDYDQKSGAHPFISMTMNSESSIKWANLTKANMPQGNKQGRCIAVVMDNMVFSSPRVQSEITGGQSQITGDFTNEEADALVAILSAGKLPAPARIVEESVVGPTLGQEAIDSGLISFIIALIVILVFMAMYYNKSGVVADVALIANMFFIMGILTSLGAVLTLPGIAGIVLTIGLAVDANILIFERVREELALGKSTSQAIKEGFKHAMSSIIDSNITLAILAVILMVFGQGPVQGFATTLLIGIGASLFSAILITRVIFDWMLERKMEIPFDNNFTRNAFKNVSFDFVKRRKVYYALSTVVIMIGIVFYVKNGGFKLGVDFKGGRTYQVRFDKDMNVEDVSKALSVAFQGAPQVKTLGSKNQVKITTTYRVSDNSPTADEEVEQAMENSLKTLNTKYELVQSQKVGPTIATDILYGAYGAILFSCLMMFIYIVIRFKKWQYGLGSVVALFHDVLIVLSFYTIFDGILPFDLEIGQDFIAAILTVMGYTMTETVVVFDRIRERLADSGGKGDEPGEERNKLINFALNSTLSRTILTSLTVFFVLLVIFIWGGESIRGFIFALLIGRIIGTYSSLCISTPIVVDFDKKRA